MKRQLCYKKEGYFLRLKGDFFLKSREEIFGVGWEWSIFGLYEIYKVMNKFLLLVIVVFNTFSAFAQIANDEIEVIKYGLKIEERKYPIIYLNKKPAPSTNAQGLEKFSNGKFYARESDMYDPVGDKVLKKGRTLDSLILSQKEIEFIVGSLVKPTIWKNNLFPNSIAVQNITEAKQKMYDLKMLKKDIEGIYFFSFSKPIFIRNNTICLFSIATLCGGSCGGFETYFLRKINGKWSKWMIVSGGDF